MIELSDEWSAGTLQCPTFINALSREQLGFFGLYTAHLGMCQLLQCQFDLFGDTFCHKMRDKGLLKGSPTFCRSE